MGDRQRLRDLAPVSICRLVLRDAQQFARLEAMDASYDSPSSDSASTRLHARCNAIPAGGFLSSASNCFLRSSTGRRAMSSPSTYPPGAS